MASRRKFIQAFGMALSAPSLGMLQGASPVSAEEIQSSGEVVEREYWNDFPAYITRNMNEARSRRIAELGAMRSAADVEARIARIRSTVWRLIGGPFEKTPLNSKSVGTIDRGAYRIEKVIFESQPGIFVTGNLYLPQKRKGPYPGIILPLGHAMEEGKAHRSYQYVAQSLARIGYVVLAFDPFGQGERLQYIDLQTGREKIDPEDEHSQAGRPMLLFGSQFELYRVWDCIRAVDYLLTRPEVDPQRIGCTGQSGGGTMAMYAAALDPRIKVTVESDGNSENLAGPSYEAFGSVDDAEQNIVGALAEGIDRGDLVLACAPRPFMILYSSTDSGFTYSPTYVKGTIEVYEQAANAYSLMGAKEKIGVFGSPLPHDYDYFNRQHVYQWFNRWLGSEDWGTDEADFDDSPAGTLNCTSTGQVLTSLGGRSIVALNADRMRAVRPSENGVESSRSSAVARLSKLLALPGERTDLNVRNISSNVRKNMVIEQFWLYSEPGVRVPGWFLKPAQGGTTFPTVLYVSEGNSNEIVYETSEVGALVRDGFAVCGVDLRGLGDETPPYPAGGPTFYRGKLADGYQWACFTLGKPILGQRVWDLLRSLDYLQTRKDVDQKRIYGLGVKGAALAVLFSGVIDDRLHSMLLDRAPVTYSSIVTSRMYSLDFSWFLHGVLKECDVPDLIGWTASRECWVLNAADAQGYPLAESEVAALYGTAIGKAGAGNRLKIQRCAESERRKVYRAWVQGRADV